LKLTSPNQLPTSVVPVSLMKADVQSISPMSLIHIGEDSGKASLNLSSQIPANCGGCFRVSRSPKVSQISRDLPCHLPPWEWPAEKRADSLEQVRISHGRVVRGWSGSREN